VIVKYIKDSILNAEQKYIAHGVNCQNRMGSGVAKVLFTKYPKVKEDYHYWYVQDSEFFPRKSDRLGYCTQSPQENGKVVLNCYTQEKYGYDGEKYVSYDAIYNVFEELKNLGKKEVAIPKIGCGLAGGNWEIVSRIIDDATGDDLDVYVYDPDMEDE